MRLLLLACIIAAGAPLLASAQFYCMTGIPCGTGCTMGDGRCINGRCFDRDGRVEWQCMAPMRAPVPLRLNGHDSQPQPWASAAAASTPQQQQQQQQPQDLDWKPQPMGAPIEWKAQFWMPRIPAWQPWSFHPFTSFTFWKPWAPVTPFGPMPGIFASQDCGGKGPCGKGQFCDAQGVCRADDCESQFKHGCPGDKGELKKVGCPHFSGFKECYASTSEGFRCFKGPSGSSISCATQAGNMGGVVWTSSSGFEGPFGGWEDDFTDEEVQDVQKDPQPKAAAPKAPVAAAPAPGAAAAGAAAAAKPKAPAAAAPAAADAAAVKKPEGQAQGAAAAAGPAAPAAPAAAAPDSSSSKQSAFKKVVVEAGPAKAGDAAAAAEPKKSLKGNPNLLVQGAQQLPPGTRMGPMFGPDGSTMMAAGPGPALGIMDVDPAGRGVAAGMASGDQKTVETRRGPNGMSTMSSSVSTNGGPAIASSVATSGPSSDPQTMQVPQGWDQPPQQGAGTFTTPVPTEAMQSEATRPGAVANSREGSAKDTTPAGADAAKPTVAVKSAAGGGLRGGLGVWQAAVAGAAVLLLLL